VYKHEVDFSAKVSETKHGLCREILLQEKYEEVCLRLNYDVYTRHTGDNRQNTPMPKDIPVELSVATMMPNELLFVAQKNDCK
jgi:hypothetical protein